MKRLQILMLLVTFAVSPALVLRCEHPCAPPAPANAAGDCHGSDAAQKNSVKLVDGHDCGQHVVEPSPAVKETRPELRPAGLPSTVSVDAGSPAPIAIEIATARLVDTGPPASVFSRPLRI